MADKTLSYLKSRSIDIIKEGQAPTGAYIAGPTFTIYKFSWFRDGSFIADAMSRVGEIESAEAFFDWATKVILARRDRVEAGEILHTRYTAEGVESNDEWPNFQLDGFGSLIWAMHGHAARHSRPLERWQEAIDITSEYLANKWQEPSHDWWEEYSAIHPATLASIYAGLSAINHPEAEKIKQSIHLENARLDGSLIVCATPFKVVSHAEFEPILKEIEKRLITPAGGLHRHETDIYYGGGEWLLLTALLGWHYAEMGQKETALVKLQRVAAQMDQNGWLPEQTSEYMLAPEHYEGWVKRWGPSARPLLWSHAMFLTLADALGIP
jgi:GH15 family glucan-1,4-alpha-glucosidase